MKFSFKSKKGKSEQSPKTEDCFLLHSYICGFSEALSGNVSPQFPWNSSTACLAWRKNYIFVNISSIPEKGKEFKGKKDRPSLSEPGNCHRIFRFVSGYIPFNDVKFVWITCSVLYTPYYPMLSSVHFLKDCILVQDIWVMHMPYAERSSSCHTCCIVRYESASPAHKWRRFLLLFCPVCRILHP